jgi:hypothetical protein
MDVTHGCDVALDRFFEHYYRRRPVNATFTGVHDYDATLPDWSPNGIEETVGQMAALQESIERPDPSFRDSGSVDRALARGFLEIQTAELQGHHFQRANPSLFTGEAVYAVLSLMLRDFAPAEQRTAAIESRLQAVPMFLGSARQTIGNRPVPRSWIARATTECTGAIHALGDGLEMWCAQKDLAPNRVERLTKSARLALEAFHEFRCWLAGVTEADRMQAGCGPDLFELLLREGHWCSRSPQDLLTDARQRFDQASAKLHEMTQAAELGDWPAVAGKLARSHPTARDYIGSFQNTWDACRRLATEQDLVTWPDFPIRYESIPRWARAAAPHLYFLHYRSPAPLDSRVEVEYLAPPIDPNADSEATEALLRTTNDSVIKLNHVVHHGSIGHHVQNFYAYHGPSRIGRVAAVDCASRIGMFCGGSMAEGWACYATDLMGEVGFLTELELIAEQHSRVRQLARAIVDIELHQHVKDERDARRFYQERVRMAAGTAAKEVTRNSMFPGAAIMYWLGTQAIHDLRAERQRVEGNTFSLRAFHDRLLSFGSIPVLLISELMSRGDHP